MADIADRLPTCVRFFVNHVEDYCAKLRGQVPAR